MDRVQHFLDLWLSQKETATVLQKDKVGLAYISKVLGLGDETAQKFAQGDQEAYHAVGMKQSAASSDADLLGFWQEIKTIFPGAYTDEDIEHLVEKGGVVAALRFIIQLEDPKAMDSSILCSLRVNAHAYK